jgi:hypothetical protein
LFAQFEIEKNRAREPDSIQHFGQDVHDGTSRRSRMLHRDGGAIPAGVPAMPSAVAANEFAPGRIMPGRIIHFVRSSRICARSRPYASEAQGDGATRLWSAHRRRVERRWRAREGRTN